MDQGINNAYVLNAMSVLCSDNKSTEILIKLNK